MVRLGGDVNAKDNDGHFPMHMGIWRQSDGHLQNTILLLKHGADIDAQDDEGITPTALAVSYNNARVLEFLTSQRQT